MLFNDLLEQLFDVYLNTPARLSHDLGFSNRYRDYFTEKLIECLKISEENIFYIPPEIQALIPNSNTTGSAEQAGNKIPGIQIELILERIDKQMQRNNYDLSNYNLPHDAINTLAQAIFLQNKRLALLCAYLYSSINYNCLEKTTETDLTCEALLTLSKTPEHAFAQAQYWQARKCDAIKLWIDVFKNVFSHAILDAIIILHQKKQINLSNQINIIDLGNEFGILLKQIAPNQNNTYEAYATYFRENYFNHFPPEERLEKIKTAQKALNNLHFVLSCSPNLLKVTTMQTLLNIVACEIAFGNLISLETDLDKRLKTIKHRLFNS